MSFGELLNQETVKRLQEEESLHRPERAEKVIAFLEKIHAFEFFQNVDKQTVAFADFESFLIRVNGIARDMPLYERNIDGKHVEISGGMLGETVLPPREEDKRELLEFAFESSLDMSREDVSYMLPAVINALHMFSDGNGRTSRVIHQLLSAKDKESFDNDLAKTLSSNGRFDTPDINPGLINWEIEVYILREFHHWELIKDIETGRLGYFHEKIRPIASAQFGDIDSTKSAFYENIGRFQKLRSADGRYVETALVDALSDERYESILLTNEYNKRRMVSPLKMESLSDTEWKSIFKNYYKLKKEHIETMVWMFKDPNEYRNPENEHETFRDMFIRKIRAEYELLNPNTRSC
ncbi:MAG TPA: Fic family protein [Candidatus Fimivivens sp.]|nr:Fic family protein [Candidatus Fimivivens sp.]